MIQAALTPHSHASPRSPTPCLSNKLVVQSFLRVAPTVEVLRLVLERPGPTDA